MNKDLAWQLLPARALATQDALRDAWDTLNRARLDAPFLSAASVAAALEAFGNGAEMLLVGKAEGEPRAMFALAAEGALRWHTFQPSQLPLGAWVAQPELELDALSRAAMRSRLGLCLGLSVTQVDPLAAPRLDDAPDNRHDDYIETAFVDVQGSFEDFWAARGKNLRQNLRKQRNKLASDGVTTTLSVLTQPTQMAGAIARYGRLESAGWKAGAGTAIHPDNAQGRFYARLFETAAASGEARVFEYLFGDHTAAMNLCLLRGGVLTVLKTAYDESIPKALSPASLLREDEFRLFHAPASDVRRIEYYGRVMDWHTKFTESRRSLYHLTTYRWPMLKRIATRRRAQEPSGADTRPAANKLRPGEPG